MFHQISQTTEVRHVALDYFITMILPNEAFTKSLELDNICCQRLLLVCLYKDEILINLEYGKGCIR